MRWTSTIRASSGWISTTGENSIIAFLRRAEDPKDFILFCCNFTPVPRQRYEFGVPEEGFYEEILNTDSELFGGSNMGNGGMRIVAARAQAQPASTPSRSRCRP